MADRKQILTASHTENQVELRSRCINPMVKKGLTYSVVNYVVMGTHKLGVENFHNLNGRSKAEFPKSI